LKQRTITVLVLMGALLLLAAHALPPLRGAGSPISRHVEPYYVERALAETGTPNLVTAILADYRGYDTFGETTVILAAGLSCYLLLRRFDG
jgi:multicomponent Na+:H+ antiporter subunit B